MDRAPEERIDNSTLLEIMQIQKKNESMVLSADLYIRGLQLLAVFHSNQGHNDIVFQQRGERERISLIGAKGNFVAAGVIYGLCDAGVEAIAAYLYKVHLQEEALLGYSAFCLDYDLGRSAYFRAQALVLDPAVDQKGIEHDPLFANKTGHFL